MISGFLSKRWYNVSKKLCIYDVNPKSWTLLEGTCQIRRFYRCISLVEKF